MTDPRAELATAIAERTTVPPAVELLANIPVDVVLKALGRVPAGRVAKQFSLGVAYPAHRLDGHDEFMTADEIEVAAWDFARDGRQIGLFHADGTVGHGDVVESYIYRGPDWELADINGDTQVIKAGDWMLGVRWDDRAWRILDSTDGPDGWSVDGVAKRRQHRRSLAPLT